MPEAVPNHLQVCAAGEQPGCVGVAQVVQAWSGIEPGPAETKECFDNLPLICHTWAKFRGCHSPATAEMERFDTFGHTSKQGV